MIQVVEKWNIKSIGNFVEILKLISQTSPNEGLEADNTQGELYSYTFFCEYSKFTERL